MPIFAEARRLVRAAGVEPARGYPQRIFVPATAFAAVFAAFSAKSFVVWTIPSPERVRALGAARLVSTPSLRRVRAGRLARDRHFKGFPEFEQFCTAGFPVGTQWFKSVASTSFATPARRTALTSLERPDF